MTSTLWFALLMVLGAVSQFFLMGRHVGRGESWWADALVGTLCLASAVLSVLGFLAARKGSSRT